TPPRTRCFGPAVALAIGWNSVRHCRQARASGADRGRLPRLHCRARGRTRAFTADWIINCAGPEECYRRLADPLVQHLFATERARPGAMELGLDVDDCGRLLDREGCAQPGLYVLGPPTRGRFWEITAVPWIRAHAVRIAEHIAEIESAPARPT